MAKALQNLANLKPTNITSSALEAFNEFTEHEISNMKTFLENISTRQDLFDAQPLFLFPQVDRTEHIQILYQMIHQMIEPLSHSMYAKDPWLQSLIQWMQSIDSGHEKRELPDIALKPKLSRQDFSFVMGSEALSISPLSTEAPGFPVVIESTESLPETQTNTQDLMDEFPDEALPDTNSQSVHPSTLPRARSKATLSLLLNVENDHSLSKEGSLSDLLGPDSLPLSPALPPKTPSSANKLALTVEETSQSSSPVENESLLHHGKKSPVQQDDKSPKTPTIPSQLPSPSTGLKDTDSMSNPDLSMSPIELRGPTLKSSQETIRPTTISPSSAQDNSAKRMSSFVIMDSDDDDIPEPITQDFADAILDHMNAIEILNKKTDNDDE